MGHLLETINPGAVDNIGGSEGKGPGVGSMVVYICRPGEGRRGRQEFPAIVMFRSDDGTTLDLLILFDNTDTIYRERVGLQSDPNEFDVWKTVEGAVSPKLNPERLDQVRAEVTMARTEVGALRGLILGEYLQPKQPLVTILADFEKRLKKVESATSAPAKGRTRK